MEEVNTILGVLPDWITIGFTLIGLIISIVSGSISRKSYLLSKKNDERLNPNIEVNHLKSYVIIEEEYRKYIIKLSVSNLAHAPNTIKDIQLKVKYTKDEQEDSIIFSKDRESNMHIPLSIGGGTVKEVIITFKVNNEFIRARAIKEYEVWVLDTYNNRHDVVISVISEER